MTPVDIFFTRARRQNFADADGYRKRFVGVVKKYHKMDGQNLYQIVYSDGDKEDLTLAEARAAHQESCRPKAAKAKAKAAAAKKKKPAKKKKKAAKKKKPAARKKAAKKKPAKKATGKRKRGPSAETKAAANIKKLKKQLAAEEKKLAKSKKK